MPSFLKPILALSISILIFAGYIKLADTPLLIFIQTRFYNPSVVNSYVKENNADANIAAEHIKTLQKKFSSILDEDAVRSSFLYNQSAEDIFERSKAFGILIESTIGLQYVQFVDSNGLRIHFSTLRSDILSRNTGSAAYRNYNEDGLSLSYETLNVPAGAPYKFTMDDRNDRIVFSHPFYDAMDIYRGTAFFCVSIRSIAERLIAEGRLKISDSVSVIGNPAGILLGSPEISKADILGKVSEIWNEEINQRVTFNAEDSDISFSLISAKTDNNLFFGRLVNDSLFSISQAMKLILQLSMFLTFFLALFLLLNIKPNPVTLVRNRIKHLRDNLFEKLYVNKTGQERVKWILELEQRRDEIRKELKRKLKLRPRQETVINGIIDKSWDELLAVLKSGSGQVITVPQQAEVKLSKQTDEDEIETLEECDSIESLEEAEELEEVDTIEEIGEAEECASLEALEEIEEIESLEEIEEVETLEEIDEVEELEEVEVLEEIDEVEVLEEIDEVEELDELDEAEECASIEELEEIEEAEDCASIEALEEIEEAETLEEIDEAEDCASIEALEEIEEAEDCASIEALEEIEEAETLEEIDKEEIETTEVLEEAEENIIDVALREALETHKTRKGLLKHAADYFGKKNNGLLALAVKKVHSDLIEEKASASAGSFAGSSGFLARGTKLHDSLEVKKIKVQEIKKENIAALTTQLPAKNTKGLLALACVHEANDAAKNENTNDDDKLPDSFDIVSPFSSMFSSLKS